jgi:amino acid transporter
MLQATALNMATIIGVGPFITIPGLMAAMQGPQAMLGWVVALVIALADGQIWSELGAAMPGSGGSFLYLREGFGRETLGRAMSFLFIWQVIVSGPLEIASGYIGFAQYTRYLWPTMTPFVTGWVKVGVGALTVALLYRRIGSVGNITLWLWIGTLLTVGVVIVSGPFHFNPKLAFDFPPNAFQFNWGFVMGLGSAASFGIYDYLGYYDVCYIGDEVRNPGRVIPRSIMVSLLAVAVIYLTMNLSIIGVVPWRDFVPPAGQDVPDPPPPVAAMFMEKIYGAKVAKVFTVMVLWTALASCFGLALGYSRIPYAAARSGYFFSVFGRLHPKKGFPHISLLLIGGLSILGSLFSLMDVINALLTTRILVQFIGQIGALVWLRRRQPGLERPFKMWFYPLPAFVALAGWLFIFATAGKLAIYTSLGTTVAGIAAFLVWSRWLRTWPFNTSGPSATNSAGAS